MAELILTEDEKAFDSFNDLDNENLGKLCRNVMHWIRNRDMNDGMNPAHGYSAVLLLVTLMHQSNVEELTEEINDVTFKGEYYGDFVLTIRKK